MAYLRKMGKKKWKIVIDLGFNEEGKRLRKYKTVNVPHEEAKKIAKEFEKEILGAKDLNNEILLRDHIIEYIDNHSRELSPLTEKSYRQQINAYIIPNLGKYQLRELNTKMIDDFYTDMLEDGKIRGGGGLSKRAVKYLHVILNNALEKAIVWERLKENPCKEASPPKNKTKNKNIRPKHLIEIIHMTEERLYKELFEFTLRTGLRRGEVLGLLWSAVDYNRKLISVMRNLQRIPGEGLAMRDLTKNGRAYTIPIGDKVIKLLKRIEKQQEYNKNKLKSEYIDDGFVFCWENGSPLSVDTPTKAFKRYARKLGYDHYTFHDLRHGFGAMQIISGTHTKTLQKLLNHKTESTTSDTYSHITESQLEEAANKIDDFF